MMRYPLRSLWVALSVVALINLVSIPNTHAQAQRPERPKEAVMAPTAGMQNAVTPPSIKIWADKGDNTNENRPIYYVGEQIYVSFQVNKDCYVTIYDIDSTGNVNILFPNPYVRDNLVRGGRIYTIPTDNYGYNLVLRGPTGEESLFAIASNYVYYHWQYEVGPPPIWSAQWGSPSTWGHPGESDQSMISYRFQQRLQLEPAGSPDIVIEYIKSQVRTKTPTSVSIQYAGQPVIQLKGKSNVNFAECRFYVIVPPY
jgi:hypothetical protein